MESFRERLKDAEVIPPRAVHSESTPDTAVDEAREKIIEHLKEIDRLNESIQREEEKIAELREQVPELRHWVPHRGHPVKQ